MQFTEHNPVSGLRRFASHLFHLSSNPTPASRNTKQAKGKSKGYFSSWEPALNTTIWKSSSSVSLYHTRLQLGSSRSLRIQLCTVGSGHVSVAPARVVQSRKGLPGSCAVPQGQKTGKKKNYLPLLRVKVKYLEA